MIICKTDEEIELIRQSCVLVCKTIAHVGSMIRPGMTGIEMDIEAEKFIRDHGAEPAFKGYHGYPNTLTISINNQVVHGIPSKVEFKDGDVISVDCGTFMNGFCGDAAYTYALGQVDEKTMELLRVTKMSLYKAIEQATVGKRVGDIGFAVQEFCERQHRYGVVRDLVGHGLGRDMHEEPEVPNHGKRGRGVVMRDGLVIAIEPMVNMGTKDVRQLADNWTIITRDDQPSAHYEHTVAVRKNKADILSDHSFIETVEKNNKELMQVSINI
jgi:methionyl aminopeptidase